jgi:hypothetical protein
METKTNRQRLNAILHYEPYDRIPVMHFGFWNETLEKWYKEGHLTYEEVEPIIKHDGNKIDGNIHELNIARKLGFDDNIYVPTGQKGDWYDMPLFPAFEEVIIERYDDGYYKTRDTDGVFILDKEDAISIPKELGHTVVDRKSWEKYYLPKLMWDVERLDMDALNKMVLQNESRERYTALYCGSIFGKIRNYWGIIGLSYLQVDDPDLFTECVDTIGEVCYQIVKNTLETGLKVDFGHFWEDICFNKGPLFNPKTFKEKAGKHYRRISDECMKHGVDIMCVDCDGFIEELVPTWLENGINTMFPVEYGSWEYDFETMRKKFGKEIRGIGNLNKHVIGIDKKTVDNEIERAKRLVDLGGFVPCFDHRIPPEADWDLTKYYCDKMKEAFWK